MTKQKTFKQKVRERMQKTGESYTTARMNLLAKDATDASTAGSSVLERLQAEEQADLARMVEARDIRTEDEGGGSWAARTHEYPEIVGRGRTAVEAQRDLRDAIWWQKAGWQDHVEVVDFYDD